MKAKVADLIPPSQVILPVDMGGLEMVLLTESIRKTKVLLAPITVVGYNIVSGYKRWLAVRALGWEEVDIHRVEGDPDELRIVAETRQTPVGRNEKKALVGDYLTRHRGVTASDLAQRFQWSPAEVELLAGVPHLIEQYSRLYSSGELALSAVWHVSRCRDHSQLELWEAGGVEDIYDRAAAEHRDTRSSRRRYMVSRPRGRGFPAVQAELSEPKEAGLALIKANAKTPMDGFRAGLEWVLNAPKT